MLSDDFLKSRCCPGFVNIYFPALQSMSDRILVRPMVQEISRTPKTAILARQRGFSEVSGTTFVQSVITKL